MDGPDDRVTGREQPAVLYLDVDDEITSAAGRVRAAPEGSVAVVLPYGSRLATSRINFRLLARESSGHGRRLSIVAPDASTRALAASAGLPVFASVAEFESAAALGTDLASTIEPGAPFVEPLPEGGPDRAIAAPAVPAVPAWPQTAPTRAVPREDGEPPGKLRAPRSGGTIPVVGHRRGPSLPGPRATAVLIALAVLVAAAAVAAFVMLPSATIAINPRLEAVGPIQLEIVADPDVGAADQANGIIPAQRLTIDVSASDTFSATGTRVESTKATGSVTFQNCDTGRSHTVGAGAEVSTAGGITFATATVIAVPRATVFPFACKTKSVGVVAVKDGSDGNVAAGAISKIPPGYDRVVLSVTNPTATSGGSSTVFPVVLQADVDAALETLAQATRAEFIARVADPAQAPAGVEVFEQTALLGEPVPTVDPATLVGAEVATFDLGLTASGTVTAVDTAPLRIMAEARLLTVVVAPDVLVDGSMAIVVGDPAIDGELVRFPVTAHASSVRVADAEVLKMQVLGLPLRDARTLLDGFGVVDIAVWPDWVTAIPGRDDRVTLTIGDPVEGTP